MSQTKGEVCSEAWIIDLPGGPLLGEWYRLRMDVAGNEISFYVDGKLLHQTNDNMHKSGGVNLYAYDAIAEFDNIVITGDEIPNIEPSGYGVRPQAKLATTWGQVKR